MACFMKDMELQAFNHRAVVIEYFLPWDCVQDVVLRLVRKGQADASWLITEPI